MTSGATALVIGGTRGIGAATAIRLARDFDTVVVAGRSDAGEDVAKEITAAGAAALALRVDATDPTALRRARDELLGATGRCDALVNCAGVGAPEPLLETEPDELARVVAVNLLGVVHATQVFAAVMVEQGQGAIVNMGSVLGDRALAGWAAYSGAKAGVAAFTRAVAVELGPRGVRANTVQPGQVLTEMTTELFGADEAQDKLRRRIPLRRLATVDDVAELVGFLVSPAGRSISGQVVSVDGGYSAAAR